MLSNRALDYSVSLSFCSELLDTQSLADPRELATLSATASPKRIAQFSIGRMAAHGALRNLTHHDSRPILRDKSGAPIWPQGIVGSITHCEELAAAAVALSTDFSAIGLDLELVERALRQPIGERIAHPSECEWIESGDSSSERDRRTLILFSAKESVYKALFPLTRYRGTFLDVRLNPEGADFIAELQITWGKGFQRGYQFPVKVNTFDRYLLTSVLIKRGASQS